MEMAKKFWLIPLVVIVAILVAGVLVSVEDLDEPAPSEAKGSKVGKQFGQIIVGSMVGYASHFDRLPCGLTSRG